MTKGNTTETEDGRRKSSRRGRLGLKVDTKAPAADDYDTNTPRTVDSSTPKTPVGVRSSGDLRSPGARKSPVSAPLAEAPIPDFITQTDQYGNATTPRSSAAVQDAQQQPNKQQDDLELDPCETLLDSIRLMCCCLVPEDPVVHQHTNGDATNNTSRQAVTTGNDSSSKQYITQVTTQLTEKDKEDDRIRLLPPLHPNDSGKKCLVLDLDETLVHSSFRAVPGADFVIPVQIEDVVHFVYVAKRPGVDEFLVEMAKHYELVIYTASLNKYADPLLDLLDTHNVIRSRLFRESCVYYEGNYVKDLSLLNRDLKDSIIVDNSPNSYIFHPENAIDCSSFIDDPKDRELDQIGAFLTGIKNVKDVRGVAPKWKDWPNVHVGRDASPEDDR
eukprot:CAMPEP_0119011960 /NCGR_PEP_ID=MMETSP1176-20130426/5989_1 /TAXON_ID=265551 /ORGANISM="Synedropsis recta cf, Strain CCMP1620" /LENGTH=386 /DNA_ID=CAMNT_0006964845 /DNA_START=887 /DNA_END=2047 /DNA_ORIENTATION=+